ncbi:MAG: MmgE/PrpD family protein, partial [Acidimicrobiales bacterium]
MTDSIGLTTEVSEFVADASLADLPDDVMHLAKRSILDGLGLAFAGSRTRPAALAREEILSLGCTAHEALALGSGLRLPSRFAAFLNGLSIHADDYDDTQLAVVPDRVYGLLTHPTAPVLPAALAIAERDERSCEELLLAYTIGVEVATKVAEAADPAHYQNGFHSTGTAGVFGAAAAAARLLALKPRETAVAFGIAASFAAGLRENFGTMTKPLHAGRAAESGVVAASLSSRGFTAATDILEAKRGFFHAAAGSFSAESIH